MYNYELFDKKRGKNQFILLYMTICLTRLLYILGNGCFQTHHTYVLIQTFSKFIPETPI